MRQQRAIKFIFTMLLAVLTLFGVLSTSAVAGSGKGVIMVGAASSLGLALKEIAEEFEAAGGAMVRLSLGSSGVLAAQIENGAPFDLFLAADKNYVTRLEESGFVERGGVVLFAEGRLVIVVNRASGLRVEGMESLGALVAGGARLAIANPAHAPYGRAAAVALKKAGVSDAAPKQVVYGENVRQALQFVQSGNAPIGIVAESLTVNLRAGAREGKRAGVSVIKVPSQFYAPIEHAAGVVVGSSKRAEAAAFLRFLLSPAARRILTRYGFTVPEQHD